MADENPKSPASGKPPAEPSRIHVDSDWKREAQAEKERLAREIEEQAARSRKAPPAGPAGGVAGAAGRVAGAAGGGGAAGAAGSRPAPAEGDAQDAYAHGIPPATFASLIEMLATQAAISMSDQRDPETGQPLQNLDLAKHYIDLMNVLEEKTRGNLTDDERRLVDSLLYELRMAYVSAAS